MTSLTDSAAESKPAKSTRGRWLVLFACILGGPLLLEGTVRFLLFHQSELATRWGADLRNASRFAEPKLENEYWQLHWQLSDPKPALNVSYDAVVGWTGWRVEPRTYRYKAQFPADKRPILWYGASYAGCVSPTREACFEHLVQRDRLGEEFTLLNYGVGGYGVDQAYLLFRETIANHADADPVVVFTLATDTDFERVSLDIRSWPKPRLSQSGPLEPVMAVEQSGEAYMERNGIDIRSYAWRYLLFGTHTFSEKFRSRVLGFDAKRKEQAQLVRRVLAGIAEVADEHDVEVVFLLCVGERSLRVSGDKLTSREEFLAKEIEALGMHHVLQRRRLLPALEALNEDSPPLFITTNPGMNHPTNAGNLILLECLRDGLEGRYSSL